MKKIKWKHLKMSGGRRHSGKSVRPPLEKQPKEANDFEKEDKDLGASEEGFDEKNTPEFDKHGKKRPSARMIGNIGSKAQNMWEKRGGTLAFTKLFLPREKVQTSIPQPPSKPVPRKLSKFGNHSKSKNRSLTTDLSSSRACCCGALGMQKYEEQEERRRGYSVSLQKLANLIRQEFSAANNCPNQRLKASGRLHKQFVEFGVCGEE
ncbi:synaptonemal complex protein 3 [Cricetulus griseus]